MQTKLDLDRKVFGKVMTVSGNVGNGKNTFAVAMIRLLSKTCCHNTPFPLKCSLCDKYEIPYAWRLNDFYANFPVDFKGTLTRKMSNGLTVPVVCNYFKDVDGFLQIHRKKEDRIRHGVVIFDEPNAMGFESRTSMSPDNLRYGYKMQHTRHYNLDIIFLPQFWSQIDLRGRRLSNDTILAVSPEPKEFQYGLFKFDEIIPISISKTYAREKLFPFFDTTKIVGEEEYIDEELPNETELRSKSTFQEFISK